MLQALTPDAVLAAATRLEERLPKILGREVDVVPFKEDYHVFAYAHMEALLTAETIWGDPSWVRLSREAAERQLREGYEATKKALEIMSCLKAKLPSSQTEFVSPENKSLQLSILEDALLVITTVKIPQNPFYLELQVLIWTLLAKEDAIRACIESEDREVECSKDLGDIWNVGSNWIIMLVLEMMVKQGKTTFSRAGLVP